MLLRLDIKVPDSLEEPMAGLAERLGLVFFSSPVIEDAPGSEEAFRLTGSTVVSLMYSAVEQDASGIEREISEFLHEEGIPPQSVSRLEYSDQQDWMEPFRAYFQPIQVGGKILVRPPWITSDEAGGKSLEIVIDPGMAFGTGTHETTRLCLTLIEPLSPEGGSFLDVGAGSGILSFYLCKRGARLVTALEMEGPAVENLRKNSTLNGIPDGQLETIRGLLEDFSPAERFDGLAANITSPVLLANFDRLASFLKPGGWAVFSGVNVTNAPEVRKVLKKKPWKNFREITEGDWHAFFVRNSGRNSDR